MTVSQLCAHLTQEELIGWAAFFEIKAEEEDKAMERAQVSARAQAMGKR